jgi:hypothetical protein
MSAINEERVKNRLDEILKNIQTEADPHLLNQYRSLIRKKVSFFQRSYLGAYLLMLQDQGAGGLAGGRSRDSRRSGGETRGKSNTARDNSTPRNGRSTGAEQKRPSPAAAPQSTQPASLPAALPAALPDDESVRLFISVGRNRRVFPREILGLIGTKTAVAKDDIGLINILNNYSFVQVRNSAAEEIIAALNGINFRGRTLAVNFARARKEEDEDITAEPASLPLEKPFEDEPSSPADADTYSDDTGTAIEPEEADTSRQQIHDHDDE